MSLYILFAAIVSATLQREFMWKGEELCVGPPGIVTVSQGSKTTLQDFWFLEFERPFCGKSPVLTEEGCCIRSIDLEQSIGFKSAMYSYSEEFRWPAFQSATYCFRNDGDFSWYVLQDSSCQLGYRCFPNGTLAQYDDYECDSNETFYAPEAVLEINGGSLTAKWIAVIPSSILGPRFETAMEWLGVITIIMALLVSVFLTVYYFRTMKAIPEATITLAIAKILCVMFVIMRICYWVILYPDMIYWVVLEWFESTASNVATLISAFTTLNTLFRYFHVCNRLWKRVWTATVLLLHFSLAGNGYFVYWRYYGDMTVDMLYWYRAKPAWKVFIFAFNTIPPVYMLVRLAHMKDRNSVAIPPNQKTRFIILLGAQVLNTLCNVIIQCLVSYSRVLYKDNNFLAMAGPSSLVDVLNYAITYLLMQNIVELLQTKISLSRRATARQPHVCEKKQEELDTVKLTTPPKDSGYSFVEEIMAVKQFRSIARRPFDEK